MPVYAQAQREFHQGRLAPDANSTLRLTFGQVIGTMVDWTNPWPLRLT